MNSLREAFIANGLIKDSPASVPNGESEGGCRAGIESFRGTAITTLRNLQIGDPLYRDDTEIGFVEAIHPDAVRLKFTAKSRTVVYFLDHAPADQGFRIKGLRFSEHQCQRLGLTHILGPYRTAHFNPRSPK